MFSIAPKGLIVTIGCPGSGKSTWAEKTLGPTTLRLERDRFRECLFGSRRGYHDSPLSSDERSGVVTKAMLGAMEAWPHTRWAVTDTGLRFESVIPFMQECLRQDDSLPIVLVTFPRTWAYLEYINQTRPLEHRIPENILATMFALYQDPDAWWRKPGRTIIEVPPNAEITNLLAVGGAACRP